LRIDPCIPAAWSGFTVEREFRGRRIRIEVRNPRGINRGVRALSIDGARVPGNLASIESLKDGSQILAEIEG
jgi:cellobiose phosphorylase